MFRGEPLEGIALPGLKWVMSCTAGDELLHIRCYLMEFLRSGLKVPRIELAPIGFFLDLRFRRSQLAEPAEEKRALRQPKECVASGRHVDNWSAEFSTMAPLLGATAASMFLPLLLFAELRHQR